MKGRSPTFTLLPVFDVVGSTKLGRYPKISIEQTFNMIISDDFLVPYAGHKLVTQIINQAEGRAIFTSIRYNHMIVVIANNVYAIATNLSATLIGSIGTSEGDVYIDENNNSQISICDMQAIWVFDYLHATFTKATIDGTQALDFIPGYISYQNGRIVAACLNTPGWALSEVGDASKYPNDTFHLVDFYKQNQITLLRHKDSLVVVICSTLWVVL